MNSSKHYTRVYFIGIGGIGMSALARICHKQGLDVSGYDLTPSRITEALQVEGISVHFEDRGEELAGENFTPEDTVVVYTPAVPDSLGEGTKIAGIPRISISDTVEAPEREIIKSAAPYAQSICSTKGKTTIFLRRGSGNAS